MTTGEGTTFRDYRKICLNRGLLTDGAEWMRVLNDAFQSSFKPLTDSFTIILAYCEFADLKDLFDTFANKLISSLRNRFRNNLQLSNIRLANSYVLTKICDFLSIMSKTVSHFQLFLPQFDLPLLTIFLLDQIAVYHWIQTVQSAEKCFPLQVHILNEVVCAVCPGVSIMKSRSPL